MVFNSFAFLIFFPIVLLLYRVLPLKGRWVMLLIVSYYFYASWQPDLIYLILFTTVVSYLCGIGIERVYSKKAKKALMLTAVIASLAVLFFFKYFNFLAENVMAVIEAVSGSTPDLTLDLILPVGISFYTFQTLSYVIDVYRGTLPAEKHFGYYALYVSYFPQLVAGPIERPENLLPQLKTPNPFKVEDTVIGLKMMLVGFFKKIAVADQLSKYVNSVYNSVGKTDDALINGFTVTLVTALFAFQIYCDFSGYTDIAIGCARIMGIRLMQNFNNPYSATNIKDFWRRWHISLTSWFTDYIYIPLGGSRCSKARRYFNISVVFLVSGIWHGAAWTYILWGVMHGVFQIVGDLTKKPRSAFWARVGVNEKAEWFMWVRRILTFVLVMISWVAFRANSLDDMLTLYRTMFTGWGGLDLMASFKALDMDLMSALTAVFSIFIINMMDKQINLAKEKNEPTLKVSGDRACAYIYLCWTVAAAWLILLASNAASSFIYFQF